MEHGAHPGAALIDLPPATPEFGAVPPEPFEPLPERLVLSSEEHGHLSSPGLGHLVGDFQGEFGSGRLLVEGVAAGEVHIQADIRRAGLPAVRLNATVRETWVRRAKGDRATVVAELVRLSEIPNQSTVMVHVEAE